MSALLTSPCPYPRAAPRARPLSRRPIPARALPETERIGMVPEYGDPLFDKSVLEMFASGTECVADVEQSRVLWDHGYDVLDVRDEHEIEFFGDFPNPPPGTIGGVFETIVVSGPNKVRAIPIVKTTGYRFDGEAGGKVFANKTRNRGFEEAVVTAFPNKDDAKIIVSCSDGRQRAVAALEALEQLGYKNLVLLKGGFNLYNRHWTKKLGRRLPNGTFRANNMAPGDVQGYGHMPEMNNANDAIEFGPWKDATDWKTALGCASASEERCEASFA